MAGAYSGVVAVTSPIHALEGTGQIVQVIQAQPNVVYSQPPQPLKYTDHDARRAVTLGAIQLTAGLLSIAFQIVATIVSQVLDNGIENIGTGIWCGLLFAVAGIIGVISGKKNSLGQIIAFMVLNILCSLMVWVQFSMAVVSLAISCMGQCHVPQLKILTWNAMDSLMIVLALTEFIVAIIAAAFCCKAACGCCERNRPFYHFMMVPKQTDPVSNGQVMQPSPVLTTALPTVTTGTGYQSLIPFAENGPPPAYALPIPRPDSCENSYAYCSPSDEEPYLALT